MICAGQWRYHGRRRSAADDTDAALFCCTFPDRGLAFRALATCQLKSGTVRQGSRSGLRPSCRPMFPGSRLTLVSPLTCISGLRIPAFHSTDRTLADGALGFLAFTAPDGDGTNRRAAMSAKPSGPTRTVAESIRVQLGALVLITPGPRSCAVVIASVPGYPADAVVTAVLVARMQARHEYQTHYMRLGRTYTRSCSPS